MRAARRCAFILLSALPLLLTSGCGGGPPAATPLLHSPYLVSRDGNLRYRLPAGWFDATADSQASTRTVWLVRSDYAGTLTVREVHVDVAARKEITKQGLLHIARLTAGLQTGSAPGAFAREPETVRVNGRDGCVYEVDGVAGDRVRTILMDTGEHLYAITALVNGGAAGGAIGDVYAVQQAFVNALRW
jgi:hypothetical protein